MTSFKRRTFLNAMAAGLAFGAYRPSWAAPDRVRMFWWGSNDRAKRTENAVKAFEAGNPDVLVDTESAGWDGYWPRLATQVAGRNAPDMIQMDPIYMREYARRGTIAPLDKFVGTLLNIQGFDKSNLESCSVDGALYGVNAGVNAFGLVIDNNAWRERGVEPPTFGTTWNDLLEKSKAFATANKKPGFYALADGSGVEPVFEIWLRSQGRELYTAEGKLGFDRPLLSTWFRYWAAMRDGGGCVTPDIQALSKNAVESGPLTLGHSASDFGHSNEFIGFCELNKAPLSLTGIPVFSDGERSNYLKPSQMFSVSSGSKNPEAAVKLINFMVADPVGVKFLGVERGVPASQVMRNLLSPSLNENERATVDFISNLGPYVGKLPPAPPTGAGEISILLTRVSQEVGFGSATPDEGAASYFDEADAILQRR